MSWKSKQPEREDFSALQDFYLLGRGIRPAAGLENQRSHVEMEKYSKTLQT